MELGHPDGAQGKGIERKLDEKASLLLLEVHWQSVVSFANDLFKRTNLLSQYTELNHFLK